MVLGSTPSMKCAFVGISNWALDPAKMNRGIFVQRGTPYTNELEEIARYIINCNKLVVKCVITTIKKGKCSSSEKAIVCSGVWSTRSGLSFKLKFDQSRLTVVYYHICLVLTSFYQDVRVVNIKAACSDFCHESVYIKFILLQFPLLNELYWSLMNYFLLIYYWIEVN